MGVEVISGASRWLEAMAGSAPNTANTRETDVFLRQEEFCMEGEDWIEIVTFRMIYECHPGLDAANNASDWEPVVPSQNLSTFTEA